MNSTSAIARNCSNGSRIARPSIDVLRSSANIGRHKPDRRGVGTLLERQGQLRIGCDIGADCVPGRPATGRILEHTRVVERMLSRIEVRIDPNTLQLAGTLVWRDLARL